ncbi:MAG: hypothetical protein QXL15_02685 [Candidatus Korarchaeota archaeon]
MGEERNKSAYNIIKCLLLIFVILFAFSTFTHFSLSWAMAWIFLTILAVLIHTLFSKINQLENEIINIKKINRNVQYRKDITLSQQESPQDTTDQHNNPSTMS